MTEARNEACLVEFQNMKDSIKKLEVEQEKKGDVITVIEKAIVAIQIANEQTAQTLSKLDFKLENTKFRKSYLSDDIKKLLLRYGLIIALILIFALVGTNLIEGLKNIMPI